MTLKEEIVQIISEMTDVEKAADGIITIVQRDFRDQIKTLTKHLEDMRNRPTTLEGIHTKEGAWDLALHMVISMVLSNYLGETDPLDRCRAEDFEKATAHCPICNIKYTPEWIGACCKRVSCPGIVR